MVAWSTACLSTILANISRFCCCCPVSGWCSWCSWVRNWPIRTCGFHIRSLEQFPRILALRVKLHVTFSLLHKKKNKWKKTSFVCSPVVLNVVGLLKQLQHTFSQLIVQQREKYRGMIAHHIRFMPSGNLFPPPALGLHLLPVPQGFPPGVLLYFLSPNTCSVDWCFGQGVLHFVPRDP